MHLEKQFDVKQPCEEAVAIAARDETLLSLFPDTKTEIVSAKGKRRTTRTTYTALGRQGTATFHFDYRSDGNVDFEKVCDGNVWRELKGTLTFEARSGGTRVRIEMDGRTKSLVPEFTIKGAMRDQIDQMARALRERLQEGGKRPQVARSEPKPSEDQRKSRAASRRRAKTIEKGARSEASRPARSEPKASEDRTDEPSEDRT